MSRLHATGSRCWYFEFSPTRTQRFLLSVIQFPQTLYISHWIILHFYTRVKCFITYPWWPYFNTHFAAMQLQCPLHTRVSDDYRLIHQILPSFSTLFLSPSVHRMIIEYLIWSNRNSHLCLIPLSQFVQSQFNSFYLNLHLYLHCCHIYHIIDLLWVYTIYITKTQMGVSIGWCHPIV